jgi:hypothetical protein
LVLSTLETVTRHYHVDRNRIYLTGMSNGGIGTYLIGLNHPDLFAALIPMAAALDEELFPLLDNARNIPVYIIHGSQDEVMPVSIARDISTYLRNAGYPVIYREHDRVHPLAGGHFFPREELPPLLQWLPGQTRVSMPAKVVLVRDRDHTGSSYWIRIDRISRSAGTFWPSEDDPKSIQRLKEGAFARVTAEAAGNVIRISSQRIDQLTLLLNPQLVDYRKPVKVFLNGRLVYSDPVQRDSRTLLLEARKRPDPGSLVYSEITFTMPAPIF